MGFFRIGLRIFAALVAMLAVMTSQSVNGQETLLVPKAATVAAQGILQKTMSLVRRSKTYDLMGLRSEAETKEATLGVPMPIQEIGYNKLVQYQEGSDPHSVIVGPDQVLFPVIVRKKIRSSITLVKKGDQWEVTTYGDAGRTSAIEAAREALLQQKEGIRAPEGSFSLVIVPAFQIYLVALTQGQKTFLAPVNPTIAVELGLQGVMEEREVIARLSAYAKQFDVKYGQEIRERRLVK